MRKLPFALLALPLAACATTNDDPAPGMAAGGTCSAEKVQSHVGHSASEAMGAAILKDSGARTLRWGPPNSSWTMDYREDRVNVRYDEGSTITQITCG